MSRMLFQEAKELDGFKDWLVHRLLLTLLRNEGLKEEVDNYREEQNAQRNVKDILMHRNKSLEMQLHMLSDKNLSLSEAVKVDSLWFMANP